MLGAGLGGRQGPQLLVAADEGHIRDNVRHEPE
jgi:hypothetical protein